MGKDGGRYIIKEKIRIDSWDIFCYRHMRAGTQTPKEMPDFNLSQPNC
jgi:hypothetical protein